MPAIVIDQFGVAYGVVLILGGLLGYFRKGSAISLLFGVVLGAWSVYNAYHPSRQNSVANLAIAAVLGVIMLLRFLLTRRVFPTLIILGLSAYQVFQNSHHLK